MGYSPSVRPTPTPCTLSLIHSSLLSYTFFFFFDKNLGINPGRWCLFSLQSAGWLGLSTQGRGWLVVPKPSRGWGGGSTRRGSKEPESDIWGWAHRQKEACTLLLAKLLISFREHIFERLLGHSRPAVIASLTPAWASAPKTVPHHP